MRKRVRAIYSAKSFHYAAKSIKTCDTMSGRENVLMSTCRDRHIMQSKMQEQVKRCGSDEARELGSGANRSPLEKRFAVDV
jgi:hypothetical protein